MKNNGSSFHDINSSEHLKEISDIKFTPREIDVMACILNLRGTSKIASLLLVSIKTIEAHSHAIMVKIGCGSREGIIDFIKKAGKASLLRNHYHHLLIQADFEKRLKEVSTLSGKHPPLHYRTLGQDATHLAPFIRRLEKDLKLLRVELIQHDSDPENLSSQNEEVIYIISQKTIENFQLSNEAQNFNISELTQNHKISLLLLVGKRNNTKISKGWNDIGYVAFDECQNYYLSFFELLKKLFPSISFENIMTEFREFSLGVQGNETTSIDKIEDVQLKKVVKNYVGDALKRNYLLSLIAVLFIIGGIGTAVYFSAQTKSEELNANVSSQNALARSDLIVPGEGALLNRPQLLNQMHEKLKGNAGIQKVALIGVVGIGGAGKTMLARLYARSQNQPIVYEINAETKVSRLNSFKNLAYHLAKTKIQKEELEFIQKIQNEEDREQQILNFVKDQLKKNPNWLLIYDNVGSFKEIEQYFPHDPNIWGSGKIILTSRNITMNNVSYIKDTDIIYIEELSPSEALTLFNKILYQNDPKILSIAQREKAAIFLKSIPLFPLDVSLAAYYLKNTRISFEKYLERIHQYSESFEKAQTNLLNEYSDYSKTRYGIIIASIEKLIDKKTEFKSLLFLTCLLDSQNIPLEFLKFDNEEMVVEDFIYLLKKEGLIVNEAAIGKNNTDCSYSIHRSTQAISLAYLKNLLNENDKKNILDKFITKIKLYYANNSETNSKRIILLIPHLETFARNLKILSLTKELEERSEVALHLTIANAHSKCSCNFVAAKDYFSKILKDEKKKYYLSNEDYIKMLRQLGSISANLYNFDEAIFYAETGLKLLPKIKKNSLHRAELFKIIGYCYARQNNFKKSKYYFEKSLAAIVSLENIDKIALEAELYAQLSMLYGITFLHKDPRHQAIKYALKALELSNKLLKIHIKMKMKKKSKYDMEDYSIKHRWALGLAYNQFDDYEKAISQGFRPGMEMINDAEFLNPHPLRKANIGVDMGQALLRQNHLKAAENILTDSIQLLEKLLGKFPTVKARTFRAEARTRLGKLDEAYNDCIEAFKLNRMDRSNYKNLLLLMCKYNQCVIKYKEKDMKKSFEHFSEFFKSADQFCKSFLDTKAYKVLKQKGVFLEIIYDKSQINSIVKEYFKRSNEIFTAIYYPSHPFIRDYVSQNIGKQ